MLSFFYQPTFNKSVGPIESTSAMSLKAFFSFLFSLSLVFFFSWIVRILIGFLILNLFSFHHGQSTGGCQGIIPEVQYHLWKNFSSWIRYISIYIPVLPFSSCGTHAKFILSEPWFFIPKMKTLVLVLPGY